MYTIWVVEATLFTHMRWGWGGRCYCHVMWAMSPQQKRIKDWNLPRKAKQLTRHTYSTMKTLWLLTGGPSLKVLLPRAVKLLCTDSSSPQQSGLCVHLHDDTLAKFARYWKTTLDMESYINTRLMGISWNKKKNKKKEEKRKYWIWAK